MLPVPEALGRSLYLSESNGTPGGLVIPSGVPVFISLHREEEMTDDWPQKISQFCSSLAEKNCTILADISKRTLETMRVGSVKELCEVLHLGAVRVDYGFTVSEIKAIAQETPVVLNASCITEEEMKELCGCGELLAMHNFYPRPETGLDEDYLKERTALLQQYGFKVIAFIAGTGRKRGPLQEGLPTLEAHRYLPPLYACADLILNDGIDQVYVGDPELEEMEQQRIDRFLKEGILELPCSLRAGYEDLYGQVFTNRIDSPKGLIRVAESREYSISSGRTVKPENSVVRRRGTITMDNEDYLRYAGEVMIMRADHPQDPRVNVIGTIQKEYIPLLDLIKRGAKFTFSK